MCYHLAFALQDVLVIDKQLQLIQLLKCRNTHDTFVLRLNIVSAFLNLSTLLYQSVGQSIRLVSDIGMYFGPEQAT